MRKVSIFTLIGANNMGAYLQAYALMKTLSENNYDVEFLTMPSKNENIGKFEKVKRYLKEKNYRLLWYKIKTNKKYNQARTIFPIVPYDSTHRFDLVIIGSDEMWNISTTAFVHYQEYFGIGVNAKAIISYAPSAGNTALEEILQEKLDFNAFSAISVRDDRTFDLVSKLDKRIPIKVVDPTFLLESYDSELVEISIDREYILIYSYGMDAEEITQIKEFAKNKKLPLYSVGTYNSWCDKNLTVTPFEFLSYLKQAKYVVVSTFHGTALSINLNKEFAVSIRGSEKVKSLISDFDLSARCFDSSTNISEVFKHSINYNCVNKYLNEARKASKEYLFAALEERI